MHGFPRGAVAASGTVRRSRSASWRFRPAIERHFQHAEPCAGRWAASGTASFAVGDPHRAKPSASSTKFSRSVGAESMVIREGAPRDDVGAGAGEGGKKPVRDRDGGEGQHRLPRRQRGLPARVRGSPAARAGRRAAGQRTRGIVADQHRGLAAQRRLLDRLAQRPGRQHAAVAESRSAVDHQQRQLFPQPGFCSPSSITRVSAPAATAACALSARSPPIQVGTRGGTAVPRRRRARRHRRAGTQQGPRTCPP